MNKLKELKDKFQAAPRSTQVLIAVVVVLIIIAFWMYWIGYWSKPTYDTTGKYEWKSDEGKVEPKVTSDTANALKACFENKNCAGVVVVDTESNIVGTYFKTKNVVEKDPYIEILDVSGVPVLREVESTQFGVVATKCTEDPECGGFQIKDKIAQLLGTDAINQAKYTKGGKLYVKPSSHLVLSKLFPGTTADLEDKVNNGDAPPPSGEDSPPPEGGEQQSGDAPPPESLSGRRAW